MARTFIKNLNEISMKDFDAVGGKNSSLGEMISNLSELGVNVPGGFAITSSAFDEFLSSSKIDKVISKELANLNQDSKHDEIYLISLQPILSLEEPSLPLEIK